MEWIRGKFVLLVMCKIIALFMGMAMRVSLGSCIPPEGCKTALAYYTFNSSTDESLSAIAARFQANESSILFYSRSNTSSAASMATTGIPLFIPFSCGCANNILGHNFSYKVTADDQARAIASQKFEFLTTVSAMTAANDVQDLVYLGINQTIKVPVRCFCGDPSVSLLYGLFFTYVARENDNAAIIAEKFNTTVDLLQSYNPNLNLNILTVHVDTVFVPVTDGNGVYQPFNNRGLGSSKNNNKVIVGVSVGAALLVLVIAGTTLFYVYVHGSRKKTRSMKLKKNRRLPACQIAMDSKGHNTGTMLTGPFGRALKFSYKDLATATDNFNDSKKIGEGGYGSVYIGDIQGQKVAIKMMNMKATKEFLAELEVLTRVHHTSLVPLIGYCTTESLFLVYEYMDNGTLDDHLKHSVSEGRTPLPWKVRVQIAIDAARGLEYIHEHTTPTYIHRDVKSSNILLDKQFHAKVADFGLAKLIESGSASNNLPSKLVGTFGYMAPEYARFGALSAKADVYSFGVVLFQIISGKKAIVHGEDDAASAFSRKETSRGLAALFEEALSDSKGGKEKLQDLVDRGLGNDYPLESAWKMAQLARACTSAQAPLRPSMSEVVVALMTLLSSPQDLETDDFVWDAKMKASL